MTPNAAPTKTTRLEKQLLPSTRHQIPEQMTSQSVKYTVEYFCHPADLNIVMVICSITNRSGQKCGNILSKFNIFLLFSHSALLMWKKLHNLE